MFYNLTDGQATHVPADVVVVAVVER